MPDFETDIFISYAHLDNIPLTKEEEGWITDFHRALEIRVGHWFGQQARVWRDPKLQGNDIFAEELLHRLSSVALLVSVISPRYVKSDWCTRELREFCQALEKTGGIAVGTKTRLFKVIKTPIPIENHPPELRQLLGYEFFKIDPDTGRPRELDRVFGPLSETEFWLKLDDLAYDIAGLLQLLEKGSSPGEEMVYLAETTSDLRQERDAIKRDLQRHGYTVVPDRELPVVTSEIESVVQDLLRRCKMSIHLLGRRYGMIPEASTLSVVELQINLAQAISKVSALTRIVWIPPGLKPEDKQQEKLLQFVRNDPGLSENYDLLETGIEDFKTSIFERLKAADQSKAGQIKQAPRIYLVCTALDLDSIIPLRDWLFERGFNVDLPVFEGDEEEIRTLHEITLQSADALLIYYGYGSEGWLRKTVMELNKAVAQGVIQRSDAKGICLGPPKTAAKKLLREHGYDLIDLENKLEELNPFIARIAVLPGKM